MHRIIAVVLSILLLASGLGLFTTQSVSATSSDVTVMINGQLLKEERNSAFQSGPTALIPLKEAANVLNYKTFYEQNTGTIRLNGINEKIEYKVGEDRITFNGTEKRVFNDNVVFMKGRLYVPISFFMALGLVTSYDADASLAEIYSPEVTANAIAGLLVTGRYQELEDRFFSNELKHVINVASLQQNWSGFSQQVGNYYGVKSIESSHNEDRFTIECVLGFSETENSLEIVLNNSGKVIELQENRLPKRFENF